MRAQLFRVPIPNKSRIGPTGGADKNFPGTRLRRIFCGHVKEATREKLVPGATPPWRGAAFITFLVQSFGRIRSRLFAVSNQTQAFGHLTTYAYHFAKLISMALCRGSSVLIRHYVGGLSKSRFH